MQIIIKVLVHLLPLLPLALGYPIGAFATALTVLLCYVKAKKLNAQLNELKHPDPSLKRARDFFYSLTFLQSD